MTNPAVAVAESLVFLCVPVVSAASFHTKDSANRKPVAKGQPCVAPFNSADVTSSSKAKKGKEKDIAKLKRPTALKKVNLNLCMLID